MINDLRQGPLTSAEIARLTGVSDRQVQRWASGSSKPEGSSRTRLLEVNYVVDLLKELYTDQGTEIWLHGRNRGLDSRRPIDLLEEGDFDSVLQLIERLRVGSI